MTERIRIYRGANEVSHHNLNLIRSNDHVVNNAVFELERDDNITNGTVLDFKKADGSTEIMSGKVVKKTEELLHKLTVMTNGYELLNIPIYKVYSNYAPEEIVEDVIDNYTVNLTYASTETSGQTITKYIAKGYLIDVVKDMMIALGWQLRIDNNDNVYFEPYGSVDNGFTFSNGSNCTIDSWETDNTSTINHVKVYGGFMERSTEETISGTGTEFTLSEKPNGALKAVVSGSEVSAEEMTIDPEEKKVTFTSSKTNPTFFYSFNFPIVVDLRDDDAITNDGEVFKELQAPWTNNFADTRRYGRKILNAYRSGQGKATITQQGIDVTREVGELVFVEDSIRGKATAQLVITKITTKHSSGKTIYEVGPRDFLLADWKVEVQDRIKKLEQRVTNDDKVAYANVFNHNLKVALTVTTTWKYNTPGNTYVVNHDTLGFITSGFDREPDCAMNGCSGNWSGTGVTTGAQFSSSGYRLSCASLNGTDQYCQGAASPFSSDPTTASISLFVKFADFAQNHSVIYRAFGDSLYPRITYLMSTDQLQIQYRLDGVTKTITINTFSSSYSAGTWYHFVINFDNTTGAEVFIDEVSVGTDTDTGTDFDSGSNGPIVGYDSNLSYYGEIDIDEVMIFDDTLTAAEITEIRTKWFSSTVKAKMVLWWAFDNAVIGDNSTAKVTI